MSNNDARVWVLLGHRKGDNNQLLALAEGLGLPFETRQLRYNQLRHLPKELLGGNLASLVPSARSLVRPPWPDLTGAIGHRIVPVGRDIRRASHGHTKIVQLGNPRLHPSFFDLVISTPQYRMPPVSNVVPLPFAMTRVSQLREITAEERQFFDGLPRPHRLMVVGGPNWLWRVDEQDAVRASHTLMARCEADGGTLIVIGSPRTEASVSRALEAALRDTRHKFVSGKTPSYPSLLQDADEIHVTADSVSMISEAILTRKPVGIIPIRPKLSATLAHGLANVGLLRRPKPDLPAFWKEIEAKNLAGTVKAPLASEVEDPIVTAVTAVRRLLERA
jgi:mitochondrial fission protein ELM1